MMDNYVRFARIDGTHLGGGMSRARAAKAMLKLADKTDIKAGTLSAQDRGDPARERHSPFNPMRTIPGVPAASVGAPGWVYGGFAIARSLEFSAREKGVRFILNRHMDEIIREQPFSGRVLGVKASYTPRFHPDTGARLESFWQNGNTDERARHDPHPRQEGRHRRHRRLHVNMPLRTMIDPRMVEPSIEYGPSSADRASQHGCQRDRRRHEYRREPRRHDAELPAFAGLADDQQRARRPAMRWPASSPDTPHSCSRRPRASTSAAPDGNMRSRSTRSGSASTTRAPFRTTFPAMPSIRPGATAPANRSCRWIGATPATAQVKAQYKRSAASDAALAINEGSQAPDFRSGPVWAIFDAAAITRGGWKIRYPYIADPPDGYFHKADTLAELAKKVMGHPYQKMPLKYLEETVARYNAFADKGVDEDFEKPVMHRIDTPPFYAAGAAIRVLDSYGGLRINGKAQVLDPRGEVIPGLYAGGEASGGGQQHGIGRASVHGYIAGTTRPRSDRPRPRCGMHDAMPAKAVRTHGRPTCAVEVSPGEVDAGAELTVKT